MRYVDEDHHDRDEGEKEEREECPDGFASDRDYWLWKQG